MKYRNAITGSLSRSADMGCRKAQSLMSAFIDSMARNSEVAGLESHLATCGPCQRQLQAYISLKNLLLSVEEPEVPADLALKTRVRLSHERLPNGLRRLGERLEVWAANAIRPLAVPAVVGVCITLLSFGGILNGMATYRSVRITDPTVAQIGRSTPDLTQAMWVEVYVDQNGKVPYYAVLSGPEDDPVVYRWLENLLDAGVFKPATVGGRPIASTFIMSFPGISIGVGRS